MSARIYDFQAIREQTRRIIKGEADTKTWAVPNPLTIDELIETLRRYEAYGERHPDDTPPSAA